MIRMGRSSRAEQSNETTPNQGQMSNSVSYPYASNSQPTAPPRGGVVSESESMARDIKEGRLSGFVGQGTVLTGETNFQAMLRVDGHLTGRVSSESGTLIVGATGRVDANILVSAAFINGTVNGDIIAAEKLELGRSARVVGNIQAPRLVVEDGAVLEGNCSMMKAREDLEKRIEEANAPPVADEPTPYEISETPETDLYLEEDEAEETVETAAN